MDQSYLRMMMKVRHLDHPYSMLFLWLIDNTHKIALFSWKRFPPDVKKEMMGKMDTNNLAESSFAEVTSQVQFYGRIDMCSAAAVSDTARNGFLDRPTTKKRM